MELHVISPTPHGRSARPSPVQALAQVGFTRLGGAHARGSSRAVSSSKVAIARAIVTGPLPALADEPTGNLDSARRHEIMDLLIVFNRDQRITILMVTHEADMAVYAGPIIRFWMVRVGPRPRGTGSPRPGARASRPQWMPRRLAWERARHPRSQGGVPDVLECPPARPARDPP